MKKTCAFILSAVLTMPAFATTDTNTVATETVAQDTETTLQDTVAQVENDVSDAYVKTSNPDIKFPRGMQLRVGISATSGLDGFIGYNNKKFDSFWWKRLGIRFDFASTKPVKSVIDSMVDKYMDDGIDIGDNLTITDGKIESHHMAALVDFYPFGDTWLFGGWRITGGYMFGKMDVDAMLTGSDDRLSQYAGKQFEIWGTKYQYTGGDVHGTASADWDIKGPYAGTGFDIGLFSGFKLFMDMGVVFTNKAAELSMDVPVAGTGLEYWDTTTNSWKPVNTPALENTLNENIEKTLADAQKELNKYKFFPIVKMGFMYRF